MNLKRHLLAFAIAVFGAAGPVFAQSVVGPVTKLGNANEALFPAADSGYVTGGLIFGTDAGVPYYSNGTAWVPLTGGSGGSSGLCGSGTTLTSIYVNSVLTTSTYSIEPMANTPFNIDAFRYSIGAAGVDVGGGSPIVFTATDGTNVCNCRAPCTPTSNTGVRATCDGGCSFPPLQSMTYSVTSLGSCGLGPTILGNLTVEGRCIADAGPTTSVDAGVDAGASIVGMLAFAPVGGQNMGTECAGTLPQPVDGGVFSYTRAGSAYCTKGVTGGQRFTNILPGDMVLLSANQPRVQYDSTGVLGVLSETGTTNYLAYSEEFNQSGVWVPNNANSGAFPTITANAALAPNNTLTADRFTCPALGGFSNCALLQFRSNGGMLSVFVRAVSGTSHLPISTNFGGAAFTDCPAVDYEWRRCWLPVGNSGFSITLGQMGQTSMPQLGAIDVYIWGAQDELVNPLGGTYGIYGPTSYIPTGAATATRDNDVATVTTSTDIYNGLGTYSLSSYFTTIKGGANSGAGSDFYNLSVFDSVVLGSLIQYRGGNSISCYQRDNGGVVRNTGLTNRSSIYLSPAQTLCSNNGSNLSGTFWATAMGLIAGTGSGVGARTVGIGRGGVVGYEPNGTVNRVCFDRNSAVCAYDFVPALKDGVLDYYSFSTGTANDDVGLAYYYSPTAAVSFGAPFGKVGQGATFQTAGATLRARTQVYTPFNNTVNMWVYPLALGGTQALLEAGGFLRFVGTALTTNAGTYPTYVASNSAWVMLTLVTTSSPSQTDLYVNGAYVSSIGQMGSSGIGYIGSTDASGSNRFNGYMDEIGFWGRTLSAAEITSLYNSGFGKTYPF